MSAIFGGLFDLDGGGELSSEELAAELIILDELTDERGDGEDDGAGS